MQRCIYPFTYLRVSRHSDRHRKSGRLCERHRGVARMTRPDAPGGIPDATDSAGAETLAGAATPPDAQESILQARLAATGSAAPPMENGELLFEAPWEARAFGMAHRLCDAGCFSWDAFRDQLIAAIATWDRAHPQVAEASDAAPPYRYYEHWLLALERTLAENGLTSEAELAERRARLAARPHGHDH